MVFGLFGLGHWLLHWPSELPWFHLLLGAAYGFHVTWTWQILETDQSDVSEQGYLFSAVVIYLGNVIVLLVGLPLLAAKVSVPLVLGWWWRETILVIKSLPGLH